MSDRCITISSASQQLLLFESKQVHIHIPLNTCQWTDTRATEIFLYGWPIEANAKVRCPVVVQLLDLLHHLHTDAHSCRLNSVLYTDSTTVRHGWVHTTSIKTDTPLCYCWNTVSQLPQKVNIFAALLYWTICGAWNWGNAGLGFCVNRYVFRETGWPLFCRKLQGLSSTLTTFFPNLFHRSFHHVGRVL